MPTTARLNRFLTAGMPEDGEDCESCSFRTGSEKVYRITTDDVQSSWALVPFHVLCDVCVQKADAVYVQQGTTTYRLYSCGCESVGDTLVHDCGNDSTNPNHPNQER